MPVAVAAAIITLSACGATANGNVFDFLRFRLIDDHRRMGKFVDAVVDLAAGDYPPVIPVWLDDLQAGRAAPRLATDLCNGAVAGALGWGHLSWSLLRSWWCSQASCWVPLA